LGAFGGNGSALNRSLWLKVMEEALHIPQHLIPFLLTIVIIGQAITLEIFSSFPG
jgi:hypothetical protein